MKKIAVVYHGDCPDGFGGAWAAWKKFGNRAEYIGVVDRHNPPKGLRGKEVYFIDWVYQLELMQEIRKSAKKVIAIDHHQTAESACRAMDEFVFDNNHSGAVLAWKYFRSGKPAPKFLKLIEDYDLWSFRHKETKALNAYLSATDFDFGIWDGLIRDFESARTRAPYLEKGKLILRYRDKMIEEIANNAETVKFEGHEVQVVNSPLFTDQLGNMLAERRPPFSLVWRISRGKLRISLRSIGSFDVSKIAVKFGGGGHRNSSGITLDANKPLPWKKI